MYPVLKDLGHPLKTSITFWITVFIINWALAPVAALAIFLNPESYRQAVKEAALDSWR